MPCKLSNGAARVPEPPLVYVHALAPPTSGGTAVILHRVLSSLLPQRVITVTDLWLRSHGTGRRIPGPYRWFLRMPPWGARWRAGRILVGAMNVGLAALAGAQAAVIARHRRAGWVLSAADNGFSVIAGHVAAALSGRPHLIWVFDLWEENAYPDVDRWIARRAEGPIWRRAAAVICHAEEMSEHFERKHGVACHVLRTPIELDGAPAAPARPSSTPREVLYAGSLYWAQQEALRRLVDVCAEMPDVELHVLADAAMARDCGLEHVPVEPPLQPEAFRRRVRDADAVFLGLSFGSDHPEVIKTATPARLPEYMASGTPLIVHAPAGSHVAEYARREDFAEVVDEPDAKALRDGLRRVLADEGLSNMRARRAAAIAYERHGVAQARDRFRAILSATRK
jgi:glycosyltransferase involved in cell wall biosynthesis